MGCDIHSVAQIKKNGKWITKVRRVADDPRCYRTFTILAGVRSYNPYKDDYINATLSDAKGIPKDFNIDENEHHDIAGTSRQGINSFRSYFVEEDNHSLWMGEHSHSWFYFSELKTYINALQNIKYYQKGYFKDIQIQNILKHGHYYIEPNYIEDVEDCENVLTFAEYLKLKEENDLPKHNFYVEYEWFDNPIEKTFLFSLYKDLETLMTEESVKEDEIRYVFGFDS